MPRYLSYASHEISQRDRHIQLLSGDPSVITVDCYAIGTPPPPGLNLFWQPDRSHLRITFSVLGDRFADPGLEAYTRNREIVEIPPSSLSTSDGPYTTNRVDFRSAFQRIDQLRTLRVPSREQVETFILWRYQELGGTLSLPLSLPHLLSLVYQDVINEIDRLNTHLNIQRQASEIGIVRTPPLPLQSSSPSSEGLDLKQQPLAMTPVPPIPTVWERLREEE